MHGGLSPELLRLDQIFDVARPTDVPDNGLLCDFLWSDPDPDIMGWGENARGVSYTFGADVVSNFLVKHDFDLIVRAHQVCSIASRMQVARDSHPAPDIAGRRGRVRVFRGQGARDAVLSTKLLRRVRQCRSHHVCR